MRGAGSSGTYSAGVASPTDVSHRINLPFIGVGVVLVILFLKLNLIPQSIAAKLRRVDWIGSVVFVGSTTSFLLPLTWGGIMYPWTHWRTLVPLIIGAVGLVGFGFYERFVAVEPMIRLSVFGNRTAVLGYLGTMMHGIVVWTIGQYRILPFRDLC